MARGLYPTGAGGGGGNGIRKVADEPARLALAPTDGDFVIQLDNDVLYYWDGTEWKVYGDTDSAIYVADTASINLTITDETLSADLILSAASAPADNQLVDLTIEADGLLAAIPDSRIRSVLSATAPVEYDSATGVISMPQADNVTDGFMAASRIVDLETVIQGLADHLAEAVDAHDASAISFASTGDIVATDVQSAIVEVADDAAASLASVGAALDLRIDDLELISHVPMTVGAFGSSPNANGLSVSGTDNQTLNLEPADETHPGGVSTASQVFGGEKKFVDPVGVGFSSAVSSSAAFEVQSSTKGAIAAPKMSTADRNAITPVNGLQVYNTDADRLEVYDGGGWQPASGQFDVRPLEAVTASMTLVPANRRKQLIPLVGSAGAQEMGDIDVANAREGDELVLIGTSDSAPVTVLNSAGVAQNGTCLLGEDDMIRYVYYNGKYREASRSE